MKNIKTGVDKLVELISEKKRIELDSAARQLAVGKNVVQEWAEFLEQEGLISIDYTLSKVWLIEKIITKDAMIETTREVSSEKDAFIRKIDVALKALDTETIGFEEVRRHFADIQSHIKTEIDTVKTELDELQRYETLKKNLDKDIMQQKKDYDAMIEKYMADLKLQEDKYLGLLNEIEKEKRMVDTYKAKIDDLKKLRDDAQQIIDSSKETLKNVEKALAQGTVQISDAEKRLELLRVTAGKISVETTSLKSKDMNEALKIVQAKSNRMIKDLDELFRKADERTGKLNAYADTGQKIYDSFKGYFMKNIEIEKLINNISSEKSSLTNDMQNLKNKALAFSLMSKNKDVRTQLTEIEVSMKSIDSRRMNLKTQVIKLIDLIKGTTDK